MTRDQALTEAREAAAKAKKLAEEAERAVNSLDRHHKTERYAAAGSAWADVSRTYTDLAALLED
ncbi:hypothetical protein AB0I54_31760 [Streptomyces sp. NPDC050625]|uniref:hypothetical protein n=1 Tax=Streptomyces sp. NPDC050625 TaxID=3154629 RepID=UPI003425DC30